MTPNLAAGAGQAIEVSVGRYTIANTKLIYKQDAYVLGRLLTDDSVNTENVHAALRIYETVRKPITTKVADLSRMCGDCYDFNYIPDSAGKDDIDVMSDAAFKLRSEAIYTAWTTNWTGLPDDEWFQAENMLKDMQTA